MLELFVLFLNNVNILRKIYKEIRLGDGRDGILFSYFLGRMMSECGLESFILLFDLKCRYSILDVNDVSFRMYYLSSLIQLSADVHEFKMVPFWQRAFILRVKNCEKPRACIH